MRVPGYQSYLMWSFQNDGACDAWVAPWGKVYSDYGTPTKVREVEFQVSWQYVPETL